MSVHLFLFSLNLQLKLKAEGEVVFSFTETRHCYDKSDIVARNATLLRCAMTLTLTGEKSLFTYAE
jgi:hypothetical protein